MMRSRISSSVTPSSCATSAIMLSMASVRAASALFGGDALRAAMLTPRGSVPVFSSCMLARFDALASASRRAAPDLANGAVLGTLSFFRPPVASVPAAGDDISRGGGVEASPGLRGSKLETRSRLAGSIDSVEPRPPEKGAPMKERRPRSMKERRPRSGGDGLVRASGTPFMAMMLWAVAAALSVSLAQSCSASSAAVVS
mmetsp:Transcript_23159/g.72168  ORF Transcript_23159/g.72168 Transcript_23159/m.72168 type:complete len:200 (-) Transcript_23159:1853-2452(-)